MHWSDRRRIVETYKSRSTSNLLLIIVALGCVCSVVCVALALNA